MAATLSNYKVDCKFCHKQCTLDSLIDHHKLCEKVMVACPYDCGPMLPRENLEKHISDGCGNMASCAYTEAGCMFKGSNSDVLAHLNSAIQEHMMLMFAVINKQKGEIAEQKLQISSQKMEIDVLKRENQKRQTSSLSRTPSTENKMNSQEATMASLNTSRTYPRSYTKQDVTNLPIIKTHKGLFWEISGITKKIAKPNCNQQSPVFFNENGYKLQAVLYPHGIGEAEGTHISIELKFLKGEFDDHLKWPFQGKVAIKLRNPWDDGKADYTYEAVTLAIQKPKLFASSLFSCSKFVSHQAILDNDFIVDDFIDIEINVYAQ